MERRAAISLVIGALVALLFVATASSGDVALFDESPSFLETDSATAPRTTIAPVEVEPVAIGEREPVRISPIVETVARVVFYACLAIAAVLAARYAWRNRPRLRWPRLRRRRHVEFEVLDDVAAAIAADANAQRVALGHGTPRNAIVACWLRLESAVVDAGVVRRPSDTSTELTQRVLVTQHIAPEAIDTLAALYREARFSEHPMTEESRSVALAALDAVHDGLRAEVRSA